MRHGALRQTPLLDGIRSAHCELWIQVNEGDNKALRDHVERLFANAGSACYFWNHNNPTWAPLGSSMNDCQYAQARHSWGTKVLCDLQANIPEFLKLIWFRASEEICCYLRRNNGFAPLREANGLRPLRNLMIDTFNDIDLREYGLSLSALIVDPTDYGSAHLAAFAFNALTEVQSNGIHQIEQYLNNPNATHPEALADRAAFISQFPT